MYRSNRGGPRRRSRSRSPRRAPAPKRRAVGTCLQLSGFSDETTEEEVGELVLSRCVRFEGLKKIDSASFLIKFYDSHSAEDLLRLNSETYRNRRISVQPHAEPSTVLPHPFRPPLEKRSPTCHTLFVGNIPDSASEQDLRNFFTRVTDASPVSCSLRRGGFKGMLFAHVRFASPEACERATTLAGNSLKGSRLRLDWAQDKSMPVEKFTEELRGKTPRIFVGNLTDHISEDDLAAVFANYGNCLNVKLHRDKYGVRSFGYITFESATGAEAAVSNSGNLTVKGVLLRVDFARQDRGTPTGTPSNLPPEQPAKRKRSLSPSRDTPVSFALPNGYAPRPDWHVVYPTEDLW